MPEADSTVIVIEDDPELRQSLERLLRSVGLDAQLLASVPDVFEANLPNVPTCLVLDVRLPGRSGLDFQHDLAAANIRIPIIFITGHGDVPMSVQAMKAGAAEFLMKPLDDAVLLTAIRHAIERSKAALGHAAEINGIRERYATLSQREREILRLRYALDRGEPRTLEQVGAELNLTRERIRQIERNALAKLRHPLAQHGARDLLAS